MSELKIFLVEDIISLPYDISFVDELKESILNVLRLTSPNILSERIYNIFKKLYAPLGYHFLPVIKSEDSDNIELLTRTFIISKLTSYLSNYETVFKLFDINLSKISNLNYQKEITKTYATENITENIESTENVIKKDTITEKFTGNIDSTNNETRTIDKNITSKDNEDSTNIINNDTYAMSENSPIDANLTSITTPNTKSQSLIEENQTYSKSNNNETESEENVSLNNENNTTTSNDKNITGNLENNKNINSENTSSKSYTGNDKEIEQNPYYMEKYIQLFTKYNISNILIECCKSVLLEYNTLI